MKKTLLLIFGIVLLLPLTNFAQEEEVVEIEETSKKKVKKDKPFIPKRNLTFSRTKSAWQVGLFGGVSTLIGDVQPNFFNGSNPALPGHNFGVHVSKSWSYLISTRLKYSAMVMFTNEFDGLVLCYLLLPFV